MMTAPRPARGVDMRDMQGRYIDVQAMAMRQDAALVARDRQVAEINRSLKDLAKARDEDVRSTGAHEIARLEAALAEKKEAARHYTRFVIATLVTLAVLGISGLVAYVFTH